MRKSWHGTWMSVAQDVSLRSSCERDRVGAVLVSSTQRVLATGYNGQPSGWTQHCASCPRNLKQGEGLNDAYADCTSIHAEVNCLLYSDFSLRQGSTLYVTRTPCWGCTKIIAAAGIGTLMIPMGSDLPPEHHRYLSASKVAVLSMDGTT